MANNANQSKTYRIYIKSTKEWVEVPEEFYREQKSYWDTFRKKAQYHGQCICLKSKFWLCDGDCFNCEFRRAGDILSLDYTGYIPIAPHLLFPQFLNDADPNERQLGLFFGNALMSKFSEVWVFGKRISAGMQAEINRAKWKNYRLRYFTEECQEV